MNLIKSLMLFILIVIIPFIIGCNKKEDKSNDYARTVKITGDYLGQKKPNSIPELFAPGIVSTPFYENSITISPDGNEIYWALSSFEAGRGNLFVIVYVEKVEDSWTQPQVAPFSGKYVDGFPFISPDGKKLYFSSQRPVIKGQQPKKDWDIWEVERTAQGWSDPEHLGTSINTNNSESSPSVSSNGTLYFKRSEGGGSNIFYSVFSDDAYHEALKLTDAINSEYNDDHPYISPDESFIIFSSFRRPDGYGEADLYLSFKREDGSWSKSVNLGDKINTIAHENCPYISPDGIHFFFNSYVKETYCDHWETPLKYNEVIFKLNEIKNGMPNIYWVKEEVIDSLRQNE